MEFIGREEEIKTLTALYKTDRYEGILVYGRRRIGKSELIKESLKGFNGKKVYFECQKASERFNVASISEVIGTEFDIPTPSFETFGEVLDFCSTKPKGKTSFWLSTNIHTSETARKESTVYFRTRSICIRWVRD